jgi:hypothetical protein
LSRRQNIEEKKAAPSTHTGPPRAALARAAFSLSPSLPMRWCTGWPPALAALRHRIPAMAGARARPQTGRISSSPTPDVASVRMGPDQGVALWIPAVAGARAATALPSPVPRTPPSLSVPILYRCGGAIAGGGRGRRPRASPSPPLPMWLSADGSRPCRCRCRAEAWPGSRSSSSSSLSLCPTVAAHGPRWCRILFRYLVPEITGRGAAEANLGYRPLC